MSRIFNTAAVLLIIINLSVFCNAEDIDISLNFPQRSPGIISVSKEISPPEEVSGTIGLTVSPYPVFDRPRQLKLKYYLEKKLIFEADWDGESTVNQSDFKFEFDTTAIKNGIYRIYVNYWDENKGSAIGCQKIIVNNRR